MGENTWGTFPDDDGWGGFEIDGGDTLAAPLVESSSRHAVGTTHSASPAPVSHRGGNGGGGDRHCFGKWDLDDEKIAFPLDFAAIDDSDQATCHQPPELQDQSEKFPSLHAAPDGKPTSVQR